MNTLNPFLATESKQQNDVRMLESLLESVRSGRVVVVATEGRSNGDTCELKLLLQGDPVILP